jgi:BlaI family penicillinase repressor
MEKQTVLSASEWQVMECLWQKPHTLMELVASLSQSAGWSKSTVATMVRRMEEKGIISHIEQGRAKVFSPTISREDVAARETSNLLRRAYNGSIGMLVNAMAQSNTLTKADIDELYEILRKAEEDAK